MVINVQNVVCGPVEALQVFQFPAGCSSWIQSGQVSIEMNCNTQFLLKLSFFKGKILGQH